MRQLSNKLQCLAALAAFFIGFSAPVEAAEKIDLEADFIFAADESMETEDYYELEASLNFEFDIEDDFEVALDLEADRFEVEIDELSFKWKARQYAYLLFGKFENSLTLDEYMSAGDRPFGTKSPVSNLLDTHGYVSSAPGVRVYWKYDKDSLPIAYFLEAAFLPAHTEMRVDLGFLWHFNGKDSYAGIMACYLPYALHELWEELEEESDRELHNFVVDLVWADHSGRLVYGFETTAGSNLHDPIGLINTPGKGERSWFLGGDSYLGYRLQPGKIDWMPALRVSVLFPELTVMEANQIEVRWGNYLRFSKDIKLHVDGGLAIITRYDGDTLYTRLDPLWALNFRVEI